MKSQIYCYSVHTNDKYLKESDIYHLGEGLVIFEITFNNQQSFKQSYFENYEDLNGVELQPIFEDQKKYHKTLVYLNNTDIEKFFSDQLHTFRKLRLTKLEEI